MYRGAGLTANGDVDPEETPAGRLGRCLVITREEAGVRDWFIGSMLVVKSGIGGGQIAVRRSGARLGRPIAAWWWRVWLTMRRRMSTGEKRREKRRRRNKKGTTPLTPFLI